MKMKKMMNNKYVLIIEKDEMLITTLTEFAKTENIGMAQFTMIGAIKDVTLGYIAEAKTTYQWKHFAGQWELLLASGNISWDQNQQQPVIHCHLTMSNHTFNVTGGHLQDGTVALKAEVIVEILSNEKIKQTIDKNTNFTVWDI